MTTEGRLRRDLSWPVPAADLQDLDVIEIVQGEDGQVLWRVDDRPAATPHDCREVLMKHRHLDEPADLAGTSINQVESEVPTPLTSGESPDVAELPLPADESLYIPQLPELPVLPEPLPPGFSALAALGEPTGEPDMSLALQATEFVDVAGALSLRENVEISDVAALQVFQTPEQVDAVPVAGKEAESHAEPQVVELPSLVERPEPEVAELPHVVDMPHVEEEPQLAEVPQIPQLAALLALTDMPDVPLALQAPELLDVPTVLSLREHVEFVDARVVMPQAETAEDTPVVAEVPEWPERPELAWVGLEEPALPRVELPAIAELPETIELPHVLEAAQADETPQEVPQLTEMAALLALSDMPDVPLALQPLEFLDVATVVPLREDVKLMDVPAVTQVDAAEDTLAPDFLDVATALQLRENLEFLDVPVLHVFQAPPEVKALLAAHELPPSEEWPQVAEQRQVADLPQVVEVSRRPEWSQARELALAREWPQVVEFVEVLQGPEMPVLDEADEEAPSAPHAPTPAHEPARDVAAAYAPAWVTAALASLSRPRVSPAERLALVGGGMLMGVFFMIVGAPRVPATANVAATGSTGARLTSPAPTRAEPAGAVAGQLRMVPAGRTVNAGVAPFPITIPAETMPGTVTPPAPRPRSQAAPDVLGAIQRYAVAYNRQDARATKAVWPSADRQALVKTFSGLREQRLTLFSCTTAVTGNRATANCYGTRRYRPRVGDSSTRFQQGRWRFGLQRAGGTWLIATVDAP